MNRQIKSVAESLPTLLDEWAADHPDQILFTFSDRAGDQTGRLTYRQFGERSCSIAQTLTDWGVRSGDRVLIVHPPGIELVAALFGCMRIGALAAIAPVTATSQLRAAQVGRRIKSICADCDPVIAIGHSSQESAAAEVLAVPFLATDLRQAMADYPPGVTQPLAFLQYTSGSTNQPRGVAISHANIIANARALIDHPPIGATWLPMFHDMGLIGHYLFPVVLGGACHGMTAADFLRRPDAWFRLVTAHRATYAASPPFGLSHLLRRWDSTPACMDGVDLSSLRVFMVGAEPVPPRLIARCAERFAALGLQPGVLVAAYGLAEATLAVTRGGTRSLRLDGVSLRRGIVRPTKATDDASRVLCSCGPPLSNLTVTITCPRTGQEQPRGRVGEIRIEGPSVAPFYWRDRGLPPKQGVLNTGDLGFVRNGEVFVCGRSDEVIIQRGEKFHPQDIEEVAGSKNGCAAFADERGRSTLLVEVPAGTAPCAETLGARVAAATGLELDRVVIAGPRSIRRTTSGKIARARTRRHLQDGDVRIIENWLRDDAQRGEDSDGLRWLRQQVLRWPTLTEQPLSATGIGSLQLVALQLGIERLADHAGLSERAELLDGPVLQSASCGQLLDLADAMARGECGTASVMLDKIAACGVRAQENDRARMLSDAGAPLATPHIRSREEAEAILLTGATGFLGSHLLAALLRNTSLPVLVLCRGTDDTETRDRVLSALRSVMPLSDTLAARVDVLRGDLARPGLGLAPARLESLRNTRLAIYHNAAMVDYVRNYETLRPTNVLGTKALLDLSLTGADKHFHHISSTFIFGWTRKPVLYETDDNAAMAGLDFGYSQSKWVAEQMVARARDRGLRCTIYRPSLISVPYSMRGDANDVAARLLAFMIRHETAVDTPNQLSLVPVDSTARNLVALSLQPDAAGAVYHMTADRYYSLTELTRRITIDFGFRFRELAIPDFIAELNRLAAPEDPVFPLLDFFNRCAPHIAAMTLKRYDNRAYRAARDRAFGTEPDPGLTETAARLVRFLHDQGWLASDSVARTMAAFSTRAGGTGRGVMLHP